MFFPYPGMRTSQPKIGSRIQKVKLWALQSGQNTTACNVYRETERPICMYIKEVDAGKGGDIRHKESGSSPKSCPGVPEIPYTVPIKAFLCLSSLS